MNSEPPKIAQFTAISGRKIPSWLYSAGANFSTTISTSCTNEAITAMNTMKLRKLRSISLAPPDPYAGSIQPSAPGERTYSLSK